MEHKGIEFSVVQTASPVGWLWTVYLPGERRKTGRSPTRPVAVAHAHAVIEDAVAAQAQHKREKIRNAEPLL